MKIANILSAILGLVLATLSIQWIFNPEAAADSLGMLYLEGEGRNTQIRDFTAFFYGNFNNVFFVSNYKTISMDIMCRTYIFYCSSI